MSLAPSYEAHLMAEGPSAAYYVEVLRRRRWTALLVFSIVMALGTLFTLRSKSVYRAQTSLLVQLPAPTRAPVNIDPSNPIGAMLAAAQPPSVEAQVAGMSSEEFLNEAMRRANIRSNDEAMPTVKVNSQPESDVITIQVTGGDQNEVVKLANAIAALHLERTEEWQTESLTQTIGYIRRERDNAEQTLTHARQRLTAFLESTPTKQLTAAQEAEVKQYLELRAQKETAQVNVNAVRAQIQTLRERLAAEPLDLEQERTQANPQRTLLEERLRQLRVQRLELLKDFLPTSQTVRDMDEQIAVVEQQLNSEPRAIAVKTYTPNTRRGLLEDRIATLEASLTQHEAEYSGAAAALAAAPAMRNLGPTEVQLATLTSDRDRAQARFAQLNDQLNDLEIRQKARTQIARIIDPASLAEPIWPRTGPMLAVFGSLALLLAIGSVFLLEFLDDRVHSPRQVTALAPAPVLGKVPQLGHRTPPLLTTAPRNSPLAEAYRAVRSSLGSFCVEGSCRRLLITSAVPGDGKTLTAANLAAAMALAGRRVILVDADMRRSNLHRLYNVSAEPGLSNVLAGLSQLEEALRPTNVSNLQLLPAGSIPPNPAELLESVRFDALAKQLDQMADIVIYDAPACLPVTDSAIVANHVDGILLVVHIGRTRKSEFAEALDVLSRTRAQILGTLLNGMTSGAGSYYHSYHPVPSPIFESESAMGLEELRKWQVALDRSEQQKEDEG